LRRGCSTSRFTWANASEWPRSWRSLRRRLKKKEGRTGLSVPRSVAYDL
jgi:hypothetical protein